MNEDLIKTIVSAVMLIVIYPVVRIIVYKLIDKFAKLNLYDKGHSKMIKKVLNALIIIFLITILISIWGVDKKNILVALSSVFAVAGVALFAQWSILSNVTAGLVIFFSLRLRIGDRIKIHDKDFPIEATIKDIKAFYLCLQTNEGEKISYPNNMILQKGISLCS